MRIGWIRFNQAVELDYEHGTSTGLEERVCFTEAFLKAGFKFIMFTTVKNELFGGFRDNSRFRYSPHKYKKCDVLIVESGTSNMNFLNKDTGRPWIRDAMRIIGKHKGVVLWYDPDPLIRYPFRQLAHTKYPWGHKKNGYCGGPRGKRWTVMSGWGTPDELYDGKINVVLSWSKRFSLVREYANGSRCGYKDLRKDIKMAYFPIAIYGIHREKFKVRKKTLKYELVYCGGDRSRRSQFRELYCNLGVNVDVFGNWPIKSLGEFDGDKSSVFPGPVFHGKVEHFWEIDGIINRSLCSCQIAPTKSTMMGWVTHRPFETIHDRSIALSEREIIKNAPYPFLSDEYLVSNAEEMEDKIGWLKSMTLKERRVANEEQLNRVSRFTFNRAVTNVVKIWEKYRRKI